MLSRSETKRILREATRQRIRAERKALRDISKGWDLNRFRLEQDKTIEFLRDVPSVFYFAEQINPSYERPDWAAQRYGAR
jgi:hypothetical protein